VTVSRLAESLFPEDEESLLPASPCRRINKSIP
jgi:hypothetical protein